MKLFSLAKCILLTALFTVLSGSVFAQNISGVINLYTPVTNINFCNFELTVGSSAGFGVDDTVLIIQMKGADFTTTNNASFGTIVNYNEAGNYELAVIQNITGNIVRLYSLTRNYNTAGKVQMVSVPQYDNVTVTATLTCQPWNGTTGGVLVFQAQNTVTLSANIDVSNAGFRGGAFASLGGDCGSTAYFYNCNNGDGANKGEGIAEYSCTYARGMGPIANAGGGGNGHNNGGAGGGNGGAGGNGGCYRDCCNGGRKGNALLFSNAENRIFPGGGGGAGHANNNSVVPGGIGGGIVIISANNLDGNNFSILANGQNAANANDIDGAGGAGAGGTVLLDVDNYLNTVSVSANGGRGGNILANAPHGPGGGGGGGSVWVKNSAVSTNIAVQVNGGASGLYQNDPRSSQPGSAGVVLTDLQVPFSANVVPPVAVSGSTTHITCNGAANGSITVTAQGGRVPYTFKWSNGAATDVITNLAPGIYNLTVYDVCNDSATTSFSISQPQPLQASAGVTDETCIPGANGTIDLSVSGGTAPYRFVWSNTETTEDITGLLSGSYVVTITDSAACQLQDTFTVALVNNVPPVTLGPDLSACTGDSVLLQPSVAGDAYQWQDGSTDPMIYAATPGIYWVNVFFGSCQTQDSVSLSFEAPFIPDLGNDKTICTGDSVVLHAGSSPFSYLWQDGSDDSVYTVTNPGIYSVTVLSGVCSRSDSIEVFADPLVLFSLGNDTFLCDAQTHLLDVSAIAGTYSWQDASTLSSFTVTEPGEYWVTIHSGRCSGADTILIEYDQSPQVQVTPQDTVVCAGESVRLAIQSATADYVWNTGSEAATLSIDTTGIFWVMATNRCGAVYDTANVVVQNCTMFVPNAFTPNGDGMNDVFLPIFTNDIDVTTYTLQVFDRWGELLFETNDKQTGWDGTYRGKMLLPGVYIYQVVTGKKGKLSTRQKGSVTLIR